MLARAEVTTEGTLEPGGPCGAVAGDRGGVGFVPPHGPATGCKLPPGEGWGGVGGAAPSGEAAGLSPEPSVAHSPALSLSPLATLATVTTITLT